MRLQLFTRLFSRHSHDRLPYAVPLIVGGALLAMGMSLAIGLRQSVWFDEAYSIILAKQSWGQLIALTSVDTHPPLYYLVLKAWAGVFGWSELALRSLSVLALGGSVALGGLLVRKLFGDRLALTSVLVMVLSPFLLRYGFEIRMYALASLIGIGATYVLVSAQEAKTVAQRWWRYGAYALLVALGMYTLYYMALLWAAHLVWLVAQAWRQKRPFRRLVRAPWLLAYAGSVLLFLPWVPTLIYQLSHNALAPVTQAMTLENILSIVSFYTLYRPVWQLGAGASLLALLALVVLVWLSVQLFRATKGKARSGVWLLVCYTLVPVAALIVICLARPMYVERYMAHVAIGGSLFIGVAVGLIYPRTTRRGRVAIGALLLVMASGVLQLAMLGNYNFQRLFYPPFKQVASVITACDDRNIVLAGEPMLAMELTYYLPSCPIHFLGSALDLHGGYAPLKGSPLLVQNVAETAGDAQQLYYIYYDQSRLTVPPQFHLASRTSYGALTVDRFSAAPRG